MRTATFQKPCFNFKTTKSEINTLIMTQKIPAYLDSSESIELLYRRISLTPVPDCQCGLCGLPEELQDLDDGDRMYECATCKRLVPWCYGAADKMPDSCDCCWVATYGGDE
jgi:hypothetical protein